MLPVCAMLCEGSAMAAEYFRQCLGIPVTDEEYRHRALNEVSTTLLGACFPLPSFSLAFCKSVQCGVRFLKDVTY